ncbi:MAG: hypothetical protein WD135_07300 [Ferruginibacter sp.]
MERVVTLSNKLQDQLANNANIEQLLTTIDMLQSELLHLKLIQPKKDERQYASVVIAENYNTKALPDRVESILNTEKTVEILLVDEAELEAELEEIKRNAQTMNNMGAQNKPALLFDPLEDIPTLAHQNNIQFPAEEPTPIPLPVAPIEEKKPELHKKIATASPASVNDKLRQTKIELGELLTESPIKDLKKAVGINDRFLFINELFRNDDVMYERSIKTINGFSIYPEAEYWIKRELKLKLGWDDENEVVKQFDQLIKRRFS